MRSKKLPCETVGYGERLGTQFLICGIRPNSQKVEKDIEVTEQADFAIMCDSSWGLYTIHMGDTIIKENPYEFVKRVHNALTEWFNDRGYKPQNYMSYNNLFESGYNINSRFETIEDLYECFSFVAKGFINQGEKRYERKC